MAKPELLLRLSARDGPRVRGTVRILRARYVVQSAAGLALDRPWVHDIDAAVDLIHASTMLDPLWNKAFDRGVGRLA